MRIINVFAVTRTVASFLLDARENFVKILDNSSRWNIDVITSNRLNCFQFTHCPYNCVANLTYPATFAVGVAKLHNAQLHMPAFVHKMLASPNEKQDEMNKRRA